MIGYYVHHVGNGHLARARVTAELAGSPVVGISSLARPDGWRGDWLQLPRDDDGTVRDWTRDGVWHWAPRRHLGFGARMRRVADWVSEARPSVLVGDVSVEIVALASLLGVPTVAVLLHGRRDDPAHRLAFATADLVLAPWPSRHARDWHASIGRKLEPTGGFGRFDGRRASPRVGRRVLVLAGAGRHAVRPECISAAATATPDWEWHVAGLRGSSAEGGVTWHGVVPDPWDLICAASVVVATAGNGSVAEVAAARRPALLLPQSRPFDEQASLAEAVESSRCPVLVEHAWPETARWPGLLAALAALPGRRWTTHVDRSGGSRWVSAIERVAAPPRCAPSRPPRTSDRGARAALPPPIR